MEDLLLYLVKDSSGNKYSAIRTAAQDAKDFLESQQGTMRAPPHELREKCLEVLEQALHSHNNKLVTHAISGLQKLLRDNRFHSSYECELESQWLPTQMLHTIGSIQVHPEEIQVEILKVLLNMVCTNWWSMNSNMIEKILQLCLDGYVEGGIAVRTAAQATASQTIRSYCNYLAEEEKSQQKNPYQANYEAKDGVCYSVFDDVIPVFKFLCKKLDEHQRVPHVKDGNPIVYLLDVMLTLLNCLPLQVNESSPLLTFMWQTFCPSLVAFLGSPRTDKKIISSEGVDMGRGSGCLASAPAFSGAEAKTVYCIAVRLVEFVGTIGFLRPVLESLFHRMLLYPPAQHRLEAVKAVKEILKTPDILLKFSGPINESNTDKKSVASDLSLLTLVMDSLLECSRCSDSSVSQASISCVVALLGTLEQLCVGTNLSEQQVDTINKLYKDLPSCDYTGPLTYRSLEEQMNKNNEAKINRPTKLRKRKSKTSIPDSSSEEDTGYQGDQEDADVQGGTTKDTGSSKSDRCSNNTSETISEPPDAEKEKDLPGEVECVNAISKKSFESGDSDSSLTEGPEEDNYADGENDLDDSLDEAVKKLVEQEAARREKLPKTLLGEESGQVEREQLERLCEARNEFAQLERYNGRHFVVTLKKLLPQYLIIRSSIEADEALQSFASKYCDGIYNQNGATSDNSGESLTHITIINADGVYLATYSALLLNLKLIRNGYYQSGSSTLVPLSEEQFVEEVHGSGVLVYLSTIWLAELYQQVLQCNFLEEAGYNPNSTENSALINLLTDLDGLGNSMPGDQLLSDYRRLEKAAYNMERSQPVKAGMKFSRRLLTACWESMMEVLSVLLTDKNALGISSNIGLLLGMEAAKEEHRKGRDAIAASLEGLQKIARLCNVLGLQSRCGLVFGMLANASCPVFDKEFISAQKKKRKGAALLSRTKNIRLHTSHILSMDVLLSRGLELGSHSPDCWHHVFRCCVFVGELEHTYFCQLVESNSNNQSTLSKVQKRLVQDDENNDISSDGGGSVVQIMPTEPNSSQTNILGLIQQSNVDSSSGMINNNDFMVKIICNLSQQIDKLCDDAASKLNLQALISFLTELCASSQEQLYSESASKKPLSNVQAVSKSTGGSGVLLLHRLGDVMLKCVRTGRPLIHIMKAWSVVGPHFMEAACNKDGTISKKAITCIHDIVTTLLSIQSELPHFHFNEALFKPFENLLCLELCDIDVQDQIISSICEFVEGNTTEIRSGWRPLFGALRAVRPPLAPITPPPAGVPAKNIHVQVVIDVFEAFLSTDNVLVFANAAVDCILCLLKHVRGTAEPSEPSETIDVDDMKEINPVYQDLCLAALKYIHRCATILSSMYSMPACPIFHAANRIKLNTVPQLVDPIIPNLELVQIDQELSPSPAHLSQVSQDATEVLMRLEQVTVTLDSLDAPSGILHVWFLLLEGLGGAVSTCERKHQPYTMESLFAHLRGLYESPGSQFGVYCINHLLLPMLQSWLRRTSRIYRGWDNYAPNFKQCCGLTTDLIVDYINRQAGEGVVESTYGMNLMLKQLMLVMIECVAQPTESISRLGCACLRHVVASAGQIFNADLWEIACLSLHRACTISLHSLYQLMEAFHPDSDNFYGDIGQVRLATRRDCTVVEAERLKQLAHQVFLLDNQRTTGMHLELKEEEDRSFIFLLYPVNVENTFNPDLYTIRVPFRTVVVGMLSHLILLQTIGTLLLQGSTYTIPSLANILLTSPAVTPTDAANKMFGATKIQSATSKGVTTVPLPGILSHLTTQSLKILLDCLSVSYCAAREFDLRPGLKFLVQKVAQAEVAANLYKQAGAAWTIQMMTLFHLVLNDQNLSVENTKKLLARKPPTPQEQQPGEGSKINAMVKLKQEFSALCELYVDLMLDKDGQYTHADKMSDQPLFFLVAQPDDFPELKSNSGDNEEDVAEETEVVASSVQPDDAPSEVSDPSPPVKQPPITKRLSMDSNDSDSSSVSSAGTETTEAAKLALATNEPVADGEEDQSKVYSAATQKDIESVVHEYKRHKNQFSMPGNHQREKRKNPFNTEKSKQQSESLPKEVANQRKMSLMKDSEANIKVCSEMLLSVFDLLCQLDDGQFQALLPAIYPTVCVLVSYTQDSTLRQTLTEYLQRVSTMYGFTAD